MNKALIRLYYKKGIYTDADLDTFIKAGFIDVDEADKIKKNNSM